jgi:hypothetical protein
MELKFPDGRKASDWGVYQHYDLVIFFPHKEGKGNGAKKIFGSKGALVFINRFMRDAHCDYCDGAWVVSLPSIVPY